MDLEGIIAKRKDGLYASEETSWVKIKNPAYSQAEGRGDWFERRASRCQRRDHFSCRASFSRLRRLLPWRFLYRLHEFCCSCQRTAALQTIWPEPKCRLSPQTRGGNKPVARCTTGQCIGFLAARAD